jgi:hypothetical protein
MTASAASTPTAIERPRWRLTQGPTVAGVAVAAGRRSRRRGHAARRRPGRRRRSGPPRRRRLGRRCGGVAPAACAAAEDRRPRPPRRRPRRRAVDRDPAGGRTGCGRGVAEGCGRRREIAWFDARCAAGRRSVRERNLWTGREIGCLWIEVVRYSAGHTPAREQPTRARDVSSARLSGTEWHSTPRLLNTTTCPHSVQTRATAKARPEHERRQGPGSNIRCSSAA